jgi:hypothetical protein
MLALTDVAAFALLGLDNTNRVLDGTNVLSDRVAGFHELVLSINSQFCS